MALEIDGKKWYLSKTLWAVIVLVAAFLTQQFGIDGDFAVWKEVFEDGVTVNEIVQFLAALAAAFFRFVATQRIV